MLRIALVGQPNCGKSTIFNHLVGYKANTSNLPGTTVEYLRSEALIGGRRVEIVDLPGIYSLTSLDDAEAETRKYLLTQPVDAILNVIDASLLSRSLELTLQLLELGRPLVVCLNMEDEARRKGVSIDVDALSRLLGAPVVPAVAVHGIGVPQTATAAVRAASEPVPAEPPRYSEDVERALRAVTEAIGTSGAPATTSRLAVVKRLEGDPFFAAIPAPESSEQIERIDRIRRRLERTRGQPAPAILAGERHHRAMELFESVAVVGPPTVGLRDRIDRILMHRIFGILALGAILYGLFLIVFKVGSLAEAPMIDWFDGLVDRLGVVLPPSGLPFAVVRGMIEGVGGAVGIVLPYLVPFLIGLALLEDIGYLPRAGYLADGLMHRIGLHGKSVIPFILGYGCSVPAVMATRILGSKRDRFITAMLSVMIPCVARATIIYGLIGYFLGPHLAFLLYIVNILVIGLAGRIITRLSPHVTPGLILEIPSYKIPTPRVVVAKVWMRVREFLFLALPVLVVGSLILSLFEFADWNRYLNLAVSPITWSLGLPLAVGVPLLLGIFRKELSLIMLFQALGTSQVAAVLTAGQMMTFALFVVFYIPCVATIAVLVRELGRRGAAIVVGTTTGIALLVGLITRGIYALLS